MRYFFALLLLCLPLHAFCAIDITAPLKIQPDPYLEWISQINQDALQGLNIVAVDDIEEAVFMNTHATKPPKKFNIKKSLQRSGQFLRQHKNMTWLVSGILFLAMGVLLGFGVTHTVLERKL